jgi:transcriptional regulator with XRE-family HTH domain
MPIEQVAMRLKRLREARGMTQAELAEKAGLSREYVLRLENASQDPTLSTIEALAKALKVKPAELLK